MANISNITLDQGSTFSVTIATENLDGTGNAPITDFVGAGSIRKYYGSLSKTASFTVVGNSSGAATFTSADTGVIASLTSTQTGNIKSGRYVYDIEIRKSSQVTRILEGQIEVTPRSTRNDEGNQPTS
jgi:hypothetical protein